MLDFIGQQLGNYRILKKLGDGGFADVYLGEHIELGSQSAIKVLKQALAAHQVDQFRKEARTLVNLSHPNIIRVLDFEVPQPLGSLPPFLIMEYASGGTLASLQGKISALKDIMPAIKQIADALQYVHDQGLLHLDIKPENILLKYNGDALLSDFGIALTLQGASLTPKDLIGTVAYMAPERLRKNPCSASDQYSLAIVVYELLTGRCPFDGSTGEIIQQQFQDQPLALRSLVASISPDIEQIIDRALEKDPQKRFPTIKTFAEELEKALLPPVNPVSAAQSASTNVTSAPPTKPLGNVNIVPSAQGVIGPSGKTQRVGRPASLKQTSLSDATLYVLPGHRREVNSLAWSPDSRFLASASADRSIRVWDIALGDVSFIYEGHRKAVNLVTWSPDGHYIASMSADQIVRVWSAATGNALLAYVGHTTEGLGFSFALAWSPDSNHIASASDTNEVHIWEAKTGKTLSSFTNHAGWISCLCWSPDGQHIASGSNDRTVQAWNARTGASWLRYDHLTGEVRDVKWAPDGSCLAAAYRSTIRLWKGQQDNDVLATYEHKDVSALAWSPDSRYLASAGEDKLVEIREVQTGQLTYVYKDHTVPIQAAAWAPDGKSLASAGEDGLIYLWRPR